MQGSTARDLPLLPAERLLSSARAVLQCIERLRQQALLSDAASTLAGAQQQKDVLCTATAAADRSIDDLHQSVTRVHEVQLCGCRVAHTTLSLWATCAHRG